MYIVEEVVEKKFNPIRIKIRFDEYDKALAFLEVLWDGINVGESKTRLDIKKSEEFIEEIKEFASEFGDQMNKSAGE